MDIKEKVFISVMFQRLLNIIHKHGININLDQHQESFVKTEYLP